MNGLGRRGFAGRGRHDDLDLAHARHGLQPPLGFGLDRGHAARNTRVRHLQHESDGVAIDGKRPHQVSFFQGPAVRQNDVRDFPKGSFAVHGHVTTCFDFDANMVHQGCGINHPPQYAAT